MKWAKEWSLKNGPLVFEARTYRYHGHSMSDPGTTYRSRDEIQETRKKLDCINQLKEMILGNELCRANQLKVRNLVVIILGNRSRSQKDNR